VSDTGRIRVGIGGWTFEPWRGPFYPARLPQKDELKFASRAVTAIEVNGTYYGSQKPESFARWREESPDGFVFAVKGPRFTTNRRVLAEAGPSIERFFGSGVLELKEKLGPVNWQFLPTKQFDPADFEAFLKLLPKSVDGHPIRHVVEVRHPSFRVPAFVDLIRGYDIATVLADGEDFPQIPDVTASFVYARLQRASETVETGYAQDALETWAGHTRAWASGDVPDTLTWIGARPKRRAESRDVFVFFINGFKPKAPSAARALIGLLGGHERGAGPSGSTVAPKKPRVSRRAAKPQ
jgi:uncharacterized protein YecE (DUF72 family)